VREKGFSAAVMLEARELVKVYRKGAQPALNGLTVSVGEGEVFGLLGPNGAGKTTAISIMNTLLKPTSGTLSVCGINALKFPAQVRQLIGFVPQEIALYQNLTILENLQFFGQIYGLQSRELAARISEFLDLVGLTESAGKRVLACSGGMKRRANLAAGILHKPKIVFLDEPTVGIDPQSRNLILERLSALKESTAMVYTTHYMEEAESLCSYVAIMDSGQIVAEGTPEELIHSLPGCPNLEGLFLTLTGKRLRD
jgi:ABC-2 type transport system ATP-binding protein